MMPIAESVKCPVCNAPALQNCATPMGYARFAHTARRALVQDDAPRARAVCDCLLGKCMIDAGGDAPAGAACARYGGIYAA